MKNKTIDKNRPKIDNKTIIKPYPVLPGANDHKRCECRSYNLPKDYQKYNPVSIDISAYFPGYEQGSMIDVDWCIEVIVLMLWENGIKTEASCCGHNKNYPSIILSSGLTKEQVTKARQIVNNNWPERRIDLFQIQVVEV